MEYIRLKLTELKNPDTACLEPNFKFLDRTVFKVMGLSMFGNEKGVVALISPMLFAAYTVGFLAFTFGLHEFLTQSSGIANIMQSLFIFFASFNLMSMWFFLIRKFHLFRDVVRRVLKMSKITNDTPKERAVGLKFRRFAK